MTENSKRLEKIEATLTFADGETVSVLLAQDADSAWGNVESVLWRSVPIREAILDKLRDEHLIGDEDEEPLCPGEDGEGCDNELEPGQTLCARCQQPKCDECDAREGDMDGFGSGAQPIELNRWPNLNPPVQMCPSCTHNAFRSGWEPGQ